VTDGPVDGATVEGLASSFGGGEEGWAFVRELIDTFLEDAPTQLATLRSAVEHAEVEEARRAAHTLKSNGATFGAQPFAELCRELENLGREGRLDAAPELLGRADEEWERVREALVATRREGALDGR
jgi:HPt (histidine-containing phosphotransfer) domain-containing protein